MALIEIEDGIAAQLAEHGIRYTDASTRVKGASEVQAAWNKILSGPKRLEMLKLYKDTFPDASVPELDAAAPVHDAVSALQKQFDDYKAANEAKETEREKKFREESASHTVANGRKMLRTDKKLDDEGVKAVEQIMLDHGIQNYDIAYNHFRAGLPPDAEQLPSSWAGRSLDWFQQQESKPDQKLLLENPMEFRRQEIGKVLAEARAGKLAA